MYLKRNNELEVLQLYLQGYAQQFFLREISRRAKMPLKNVQNILNSLECSRILKSSMRGRNKYFYLNIDNVQTKLYLLQAEIYRTRLFLEKYPSFKTFLKEVSTGIPLVVFGSFAKFAAEKDSDVDMLIIAGEGGKLPLHVLPYQIHCVRLPEKSFIKALKKKETLVKEIDENHVILNNHSFYVNAMWGNYGE